MDNFSSSSLLDVFIYETTQNIEQLEAAILASEKTGTFTPQAVNEIFRIMHTIKGSSAMMMFNNISSLSHAIEDVFYFIREEKTEKLDCALLSDLILEGVDFIKLEMEKVKNFHSLDGDPSNLIKNIKEFLSSIKGEPRSTDTLNTSSALIEVTVPLDSQTSEQDYADQGTAIQESKIAGTVDLGQAENRSSHQSIISVDVMKLDKMMDLMGEMVIAEAMVTQNPELQGLNLNSFYKAARQLHKITSEMQDMVMSIRMVPLAATFHKLHRVVRDMSRKLNKEVELVLIGENTEVDKNIIEHISDPLMHLVRNAVDHGIEDSEERTTAGKQKAGQVILEAKNAGGDVLVTVRDDGKGLDKEKILKKARENGLLSKPENEMTDKEIYNLIFMPGFSTNDNVTEFSGRGVGMDVVLKNLEAVGGSVSVDSIKGFGTATTMKIPLTLAIIDGMNIRVGGAKYTLPTTSIKETFQVKKKDIIKDPNDNEMIMVRGECYPIVRIHEIFAVETEITDLTQGIMLMIEQDEKRNCLFADELLGQQQVVVKALPSYMKNIRKVEGLAGCTLLGDGTISLILNIGGLIGMES